ncbi:GntR family transcriptional regulator [Arthrobacter sp. PM3]|uniref:GntR family transcriptional regulator n=1 Tax=Arthrobacter sp. PM3 TaxID=2017685 RepID=UPI000E105033|nr:GntR family transcriptional regulator [Arthrobacter sp. PM3]AXJ09177.1 GntR family transcriptional regulator [Arthrobacter sp. PM3]
MATAPLLGLEKKSLREQALSALRTAITSGELEPGRHLVETELSDMLQISRGTLREALRQLEQEGLLSAGPRGRLSVRHLDGKEIRDIFAVRAALESLAVRTLCELPDRASVIASLRAAIDTMAAAAEASLEERIESDLEFHRTLCRLTGNETLLHSWESLEGSIRMSIMFAGIERAVRNMSVDRHHDIVAAIETGDAALARTTILEHMDGAAANLVA